MSVRIDDLTVREVKELQALLGNNTSTQNTAPTYPQCNAMVGKKCIIRTYSAGVWFGLVSEKQGNEVIITNARRLWRWKAKESISLSAVATKGIASSESDFAPVVDSVWLEAIELIPCSPLTVSEIENEEDSKQ